MATETSVFSGSPRYRPAAWREWRGVALPAHFGDVAGEFVAARDGRAVTDRSDRGVLLATGKDRASWLHNLVTNAVKTLAAGDGAYAFAIDVKGRIQFDLNTLVLEEALWLDIDRATVTNAVKHFDRFLISEDVKLDDASGRFARLGLSGAAARETAAALGVPALGEAPALAHVALPEGGRAVRHDFAGSFGVELIVPVERAAEWWDRLAGDLGCTPCGMDAVDALRIEAGIAWLWRDIDDKVLPPETGTAERSISYKKGCYLGQEIIERMRSHGSLARRLVRLAAPAGPAGAVELPVAIRLNGAEVGRITSLVRHPVDRSWIGLGYLKSSIADSAGLTFGDPPLPLELRV